MGKITIQIQPQNFELIRDRIGEILTLELADQAYSNNVSVWKERIIPFNHNELPAVNVAYDNTPYETKTPITQTGINEYYIDIHVNAKHSASEQGDVLASLKAQRLAGIIAYILRAPEYITLDFNPGVIHRTEVSDIKIGKLANQDSIHTVVARLIFKATANEDVKDIEGVDGEIYSTQIKINETEKGHKFELNS